MLTALVLLIVAFLFIGLATKGLNSLAHGVNAAADAIREASVPAPIRLTFRIAIGLMLLLFLIMGMINGARAQATDEEPKMIGAVARVFSFLIGAGGARITITQRNGHDFVELPSGSSDTAIAAAPVRDEKAADQTQEAPCVYALVGRPTNQANYIALRYIDFTKIGRWYETTTAYNSTVTARFYAARGALVNPYDGTAYELTFRLPLGNHDLARLIEAMEFIQRECPPLEPRPY